MEEFYTTNQVADMLKVNIITVRRWIDKGLITAYKLRKDYRVKKSDFEQFLNERRVKK